MKKVEVITDPKEVRRILNEYYHGNAKPGKKWNSGKRNDLGDIFFRSSWEANVARYLNFLKAHGEVVAWEYEPKRFYFEGYKRGTTSYLPDFKVWKTKCAYEWWEVKGCRKQKGMTALKRMAKHYPDEKIVVIDERAYRDIKRQVGTLIPFWE